MKSLVSFLIGLFLLIGFVSASSASVNFNLDFDEDSPEVGDNGVSDEGGSIWFEWFIGAVILAVLVYLGYRFLPNKKKNRGKKK
jgi:uncharacterized BrkB/YihY/UPF0761 family membrane protein